jgi:proteasome lid subunit RPN8/RPN11
MPPDRLIIRRRVWRTLWRELQRRSAGRRESGAFLLGVADGREVLDIVYFDDVDPSCLVGSIAIDGEGFTRLWEHCQRVGLRVLADVHTHPSAAVSLSSVDRANPMVAMVGHIGIIVPHYAAGRRRRRSIGVHRYDGERGWTSFLGWDAHRRIKLR